MAVPIRNQVVKDTQAFLRCIEGMEQLPPELKIEANRLIEEIEADENEQILEEMKIDGDLPEPKSGAWIV